MCSLQRSAVALFRSLQHSSKSSCGRSIPDNGTSPLRLSFSPRRSEGDLAWRAAREMKGEGGEDLDAIEVKEVWWWGEKVATGSKDSQRDSLWFSFAVGLAEQYGLKVWS